jgi:hypothetical protein
VERQQQIERKQRELERKRHELQAQIETLRAEFMAEEDEMLKLIGDLQQVEAVKTEDQALMRRQRSTDQEESISTDAHSSSIGDIRRGK